MFRSFNFSIVLLALLMQQAKAAPPKPVVIGFPILNALGRSQEAALFSMFNSIVTVFNKTHHENFQIQVFRDENLYKAGVIKNQFGVALGSWAVDKKFPYRVFLTVSLFGEDEPLRCLYVRKNNLAKNHTQLKNQRILMPGGFLTYASLRKTIGTRPDTFFKNAKIPKDDVSALYALALNETDVVAVKRGVYNFLKVTNPGPVKDIRPIICYPDGQWWSLAYNPNFDKKRFEAFALFAAKIATNPDPSLVRLRPLIRSVGLKVIPIKHEDNEKKRLKLLTIFKDGEKHGWRVDYENWKNLTRIK